jgi:beta-galactosidase
LIAPQRFTPRMIAVALAVVAAMCAAPPSSGQAAERAEKATTVRIDASAAVPAPVAVAAHLGSARNPSGDVIGANSQYLTMDGKPWLPVMGEFHYSRYPANRWEEEILKMKAAGVQIVSTYVIWIHHEEHEGQFDWAGQRDLRRFTELCGKHGMYVYPRIGPWAHAEVRNGGIPDWVLKQGPVRRNDAKYLASVGAFYQQIGEQLKGEMWKDGGPVIGIQIENEYRDRGPGRGAEHIRTLKQMAIKAGMDVPLYTVTGWDGAAIPLDAVLPVFGGYPDAPWDGSAKKLPPNEVYAFRFDNRAAGSMGAIGSKSQNAASSYAGTPFLTAEVGDGIEDTYFRRPVVSGDDIAAIVPVMLGSGANLLGYYMFHGGRNPEGDGITLQESQRTGYPTDVPTKSYDFQAPLGEFGQERPSLDKLKLVHYFLEDFGATLAPMSPRRPAALPAEPGDLSVPRVSARTLGDRGFVFFNNHVRGAEMPRRNAFQVELKLPGGVASIPEQPIVLPSDTYGIWPVNLVVGTQTLRYSTAQLFQRIMLQGKPCYLFFAIDGVAAEFAFAHAVDVERVPRGFARRVTARGIVLRAEPGASGQITLRDKTSLVLMSEHEAEQIWRDRATGTLLSTSADAYADGGLWTLQSLAKAEFRFGLLGGELVPAQNVQPASDTAGRGAAALFRWYTTTVPTVDVQAKVVAGTAGGERPPMEFGPALAWRPGRIPMAPDAKDFADAARWEIQVPALPASATQVSDLLLRIQYSGDVARLYQGERLIDDNFWNGLPWEVGLGEVPGLWPQKAEALQLRILPLPAHAPMYMEGHQAAAADGSVAAHVDSVTLLATYQLRIRTVARK